MSVPPDSIRIPLVSARVVRLAFLFLRSLAPIGHKQYWEDYDFYGLVESYRSIVEHRRKFINLRDFDYDMLYPATLSILPPASVADLWRKDYENMKKTMIYGNSPSYEQLLKRLAELQKEIKMLPYQP